MAKDKEQAVDVGGVEVPWNVYCRIIDDLILFYEESEGSEIALADLREIAVGEQPAFSGPDANKLKKLAISLSLLAWDRKSSTLIAFDNFTRVVIVDSIKWRRKKRKFLEVVRRYAESAFDD